MKIRFVGGPLHGKDLAVSSELARMHRLEFRVTSIGERSIPREEQQVAIYTDRETRGMSIRFFIGMADEE